MQLKAQVQEQAPPELVAEVKQVRRRLFPFRKRSLPFLRTVVPFFSSELHSLGLRNQKIVGVVSRWSYELGFGLGFCLG